MGRAKIKDEFTGLPVSRQRKCQLRHQKEGRCIICGKPLCSAQFCLEHMVAARERLRQRTGAVGRNRGSRSYRLAALARKKKRR